MAKVEIDWVDVLPATGDPDAFGNNLVYKYTDSPEQPRGLYQCVSENVWERVGLSDGANVITVTEEAGIVLDAPADPVFIGDYNGATSSTGLIIDPTSQTIKTDEGHAAGFKVDGVNAVTKLGDHSGWGNGTTVTVLDDDREVVLQNVVKFSIPGLPTVDPGIAGQWWNDNGALKISAG